MGHERDVSGEGPQLRAGASGRIRRCGEPGSTRIAVPGMQTTAFLLLGLAVVHRAGLAFSIAATPGAIIGALVTTRLPRTTFEVVLALMLLVGAAFLLFRAFDIDGV